MPKKPTLPAAEQLHEELWNLVQRDQGYGFVSENGQQFQSKQEFFNVARGWLYHSEAAVKKLRKFMRKHNQPY